MTTITDCTYSAVSGQPQTPLRDKVSLLNKDGSHDISQRVRNVVQQHLSYKGTDVFQATITKTQITFTLQNGPATETRTLKYEGNKWMLQKGTDARTEFEDPTNQIGQDIENILANIRGVFNSRINDTNPAATPPPTGRLSEDPSTPRSDPDFDKMLEKQKKTNKELKKLNKNFAEFLELFKAGKKTPPELEGKLKELQERVAALGAPVEEVERLRTELKSAHHSSAENNNKIQTLEKNLKERMEMIESLQKQLAEAKQALSTQAGTSAQELTQKIAEIEQLKKKSEQVAEEHEKATRDLNAKLKENTEELGSLNRLLAILQNKLEVAAQTKINLEARLSTAQLELETARTSHNTEVDAQLKTKQDRINQLDADLTKSQSRTSELEGQLALQNRKIDSLEQANTALRNQLARDKAAADKINTGLKEHLQKAEKDLQSKTLELEQLKKTTTAELATAQFEAQNQRAAITTLEKAQKSLNIQLQQATETITNLEQRLAASAKSLGAAQVTNTQLQKANKVVADNIDSLNDQLALEKVAKEVIIQEKERLSQELSAAKTLIEQQNLDIRALHEQLKAMEAKRAEQTSDLGNKFSSVQNDLARAEAAVRNIMSKRTNLNKNI